MSGESLIVEMKEFDHQLITLACEIRECKKINGQITRSYPEHIRRLSQTLESNLINVDLIVSQIQAMLMNTRLLLEQQYSDANQVSKQSV